MPKLQITVVAQRYQYPPGGDKHRKGYGVYYTRQYRKLMKMVGECLKAGGAVDLTMREPGPHDRLTRNNRVWPHTLIDATLEW